MTKYGNMLWRTDAPELATGVAIDYFGQAELLKLMTQFGWITVGVRELDRIGVDFLCVKGKARIDLQLKSANLSERESKGKKPRKMGSWTWKIFEHNKDINMRFYGEESNFLVVVALEVRKSRHDGEYIEQYSRIALIPATEIKSILATSKKKLTHNLTISKNLFDKKKTKIQKYFEEKTIREILLSEEEKQNRNALESHI